jgi:deoxyribonuclease V
VRVDVPHEWPTTVDDAVRIQRELRSLVRTTPPQTFEVRTVAGLDVAYAGDSDRLAAAAVVLDMADLRVVESAVVHGESRFSYVPGLFAFRELPALVDVLRRLTILPDLLFCDGQGLAHPRRFGLACHVGVLTGVSTVGVAKTPLGRFDPPADGRGATSPLILDDDVVGAVLRTQHGVRPVFVSPGHLIDTERACAEVLRCTPTYRLPEPIRQADHLSREALRSH